jgi:hypothetical protein
VAVVVVYRPAQVQVGPAARGGIVVPAQAAERTRSAPLR